MRLYKVYTINGSTGKKRWVGTLADSATLRKEWNTKYRVPRDHILTMEVEVPTSKAGLLEFLNHEIQ